MKIRIKKIIAQQFYYIKNRTASVTLMNNDSSNLSKENQTIVGETSVPIKKGIIKNDN